MIPAHLSSALANHVWQSTLFAVAAGLLAFALRKNHAQARYWLWLTASLKFLVPFSLIVALGGLLTPQTAAPITQPGVSAVVAEIGQTFAAPAVSVPAVHSTMNPVPIVLFAVWLCGFLIVVFRWCVQWRHIRGVARAGRLLNMEAAVPVLSSPALLEPGVFGIFRPVLLLPDGIAEHLTRGQLHAILAHELCHVRRRDNLAAAIHMFVEAIFWFHPLVWWIGARLVEERERACDEEVLRLGSEPQVYAESILKTCEFYLESPLACMSGVTGADLKKRIVRIMTQRTGYRVSFAGKALLAAAGIFAVAGPLAFGFMNGPQAQSQAGQTPATRPTFEVASIKPDNSAGHFGGIQISPGGRFVATNVPLKMLIAMAYKIENSQLIGGPAWINSQRFDIQAEAPGSSHEDIMKMTDAQREAYMEQEQLRLQSLLEDRFQLKLRRDTKDRPIYALVVAKGGPKLQETPAQDTASDQQPHGGTAGRDGALSQKGVPLKGRQMRMSRGQLSGNDVQLSFLATQLSNQLGRPVVDQTGLKGNYSFTLQWTPDESQRQMGGGPAEEGPQSAGNTPPPPETAGPSVFTAIQEQLGLKLKPEKGPVEVYVIDHVEQPSEN
jgi:bla regulator protein BlaR1